MQKRNQCLLVGAKVIGFTCSSQAIFIDSSSNNNLPFVENCSEHGSWCFHGSNLLPLRLLVVVCKHLIGCFTFVSKMKMIELLIKVLNFDII